MKFRIGHMEAWTTKQQSIVGGARQGAGVQAMLFNSADFGGLNDAESLALEALALRYAN